MGEWYRWVMGDERHPITDAAMDYIRAEKPAGTRTSVLWGDARIGNMLFSEGKVSVALDWELASVGPGELDLAWWIVFDQLLGPGLRAPRLAGLPSREQTIARYEQTAGYAVGELHYYEVFSVLRFAIIVLRFAKMYTGTELFPNGTDMGTNSHAMQMLAELMGMPGPQLSRDCLSLLRPDLAPADVDTFTSSVVTS
jgi:aminoglycoside phosphotransferase (APT) family kinase protein